MKGSADREFTEFVREHGDALLRYARLLVPDSAEAEDLLQVALLRLSQRWGHGVDAPVAYVRVSLVNLVKDGARRRHLVPRPVDMEGRDGADTSPDVADAILARDRLDELLGSLPPRQRAAVVLRVVDGLSEAETAALLGCSVGTVKSNLARGLDKLRLSLATTLTTPAEETS